MSGLARKPAAPGDQPDLGNVLCQRDLDSACAFDIRRQGADRQAHCLDRSTIDEDVDALILRLKSRYGFAGGDVDDVTVAGSEKMLSHHNIPEPRDLAMAQYSTPFCVALACFLDPRDPSAFSETALSDRGIRELCRKVKLELRRQTTTAQNPLACRVKVGLKDGRELVEEIEHFPGTPEQPLDRAGLREKFETITAGLRQNRPADVFDTIATLERASNVGALPWSF